MAGGKGEKLKGLRSGDFKDLLSIQSQMLVSDGAGGQMVDGSTNTDKDGWQEVCQAWAKLEPFRGWKNPFALQNRSTITHTITVPYDGRIKSDMRAVLGSRYFAIKAVIDVQEEHILMELAAVEGEPT